VGGLAADARKSPVRFLFSMSAATLMYWVVDLQSCAGVYPSNWSVFAIFLSFFLLVDANWAYMADKKGLSLLELVAGGPRLFFPVPIFGALIAGGWLLLSAGRPCLLGLSENLAKRQRAKKVATYPTPLLRFLTDPVVRVWTFVARRQRSRTARKAHRSR